MDVLTFVQAYKFVFPEYMLSWTPYSSLFGCNNQEKSARLARTHIHSAEIAPCSRRPTVCRALKFVSQYNKAVH